MNKKIISIASIIFSIIFVAIFIVIWNNTRNIIRSEADEMNAVYSTEYDFDISLFDNRVVTSASVQNLAYNINDSGYSQSVKLKFYEYSPTGAILIGNKESYNNYTDVINLVSGATNRLDANKDGLVKTTLNVSNSNGVVDGIVISDN